jgi:pilus assembly protein CpaE
MEELLAALSDDSRLACRTRVLVDGGVDNALGARPPADVLVLRFDAGSLDQLAALTDAEPAKRPPLIVVGPAGNAEAVRLAIRSGARDFLPEPVSAGELKAAVHRVLDESARESEGQRKSDVIVVIGAAGGAGTSFVACNLAHVLATTIDASTLLMDLDLDNAPLGSFLDLAPERGLAAALSEVKFLDEHALAGYVTRHRSGLHLMGAPSGSLSAAKQIEPGRFPALIDVVTRSYRHVVVDAGRSLDSLGLAAVSTAHTILLVMQQSVVQLKQAARMLHHLTSEVGIPGDRVFIVVNRHLKHAAVTLEDVRSKLGCDHVVQIPNHYQAVLASIDGGVPICELDKTSPVAKAIVQLARTISGEPPQEHRSLLRRALSIRSGG